MSKFPLPNAASPADLPRDIRLQIVSPADHQMCSMFQS
jgi:hypothetical protein